MSSHHFQEPTILYIDDQPSHLSLFQKAFQGDYLVLTTSSAEEGLEILKTHDVFLVIADHNMPHMTGIDFLQNARKTSPQALQVILSAYLNEAILKEAKEKLNLFGHLQKPWKLDRVRSFLEEAYQKYEIGETSLPESQPEIKRPSISPRDMASLASALEGKVNAAGAKRVFLNYVEPPLRTFIPRIERPIPDSLRLAQQEAIKGNLPQLEIFLTSYLKEFSKLSGLKYLLESRRRVMH